MPRFSLNVLTINTHKGFTAFNRRFILPELREAVRSVSADIVCLQEVMGAHEIHPLHIENWPDTTHYEFLADTMWSDYAYGRNAVYPEGHHGNAVLSRFPIEHYQNLDVSVATAKSAACSTAASCRRKAASLSIDSACTWGCALINARPS
jgi:endonuclease/exonuclease/phosphatase family metal-dependent hydrolase